jgi:ribosome-associated protein
VILVTSSLTLDENEFQFVFSRSSGPGGQNVNKVATAVQLRFDVVRSPSLPDDVKDRLIRLAGSRMTQEGVLVINARRYRSQEKNREDAVERLLELVRAAAQRPKRRIKTKPTQSSRERRLREKRHRSKVKSRRRPATDDGD